MGYLCVYKDNREDLELQIMHKSKKENFLELGKVHGNVLGVILRNYRVLKMLEYKVAFGYVALDDKTYLRTVVLTKNENVIDINRHLHKEVEDNTYHIVTEININEYLDTLVKGNGSIIFWDREEERQWEKYFKKQGITLIK